MFFPLSQAQNLNQSLATVLEVIGEVKLNNFSEAQLRDKAFIKQWFDIRLQPFLPSASREFLSCLATKSFTCETFRAVYVPKLYRQAWL